MSRTILGKVGIILKKNWNAETQYKRLDVVTHNGRAWGALIDNKGIEPVEGDTWQMLADKGYFTEEDKATFKQAVVAESKVEMDNYTDDKKNELHTYTGTKKTELNTHANTKKDELDTYESAKETALNTLAETLTTTFNTNATQKTTDYNDNATAKTNTFNTNATEKTNTFNTNAESKTTDFNTNASTKTDTFNTNATDKTTTFNANTESKATDFNNNATEKVSEYNQNAAEKIQEYNNNAQSLQQEVTELAENALWNTTEQNTYTDVDDAAKYSKNKIAVVGRSWQDSRSGKNYFNNIDNYTEKGTNVYKYEYNLKPNTEYTISSNCPVSAIANLYANSDTSANRVHIGKSMTITTNDNGYFFILVRYKGVSDDPATFDLYSAVKEGTYYIQIEEGSTATDYEPYGAMPSPEFPSTIQNVTGNVEVTDINKNYIDEVYNGYYNVESGSLTSNNNYRTFIINRLLPGTYTFTTNLTNCFLLRTWKDRTNKNIATATDRLTFTTTTTGRVMVCVRNTNTTEITEDFYAQIEKGETATEYTPHAEHTVTFPLAEGQRLMEGDYLAEDGIHHMKDQTELSIIKSLSTATLNGVASQTAIYNIPKMKKQGASATGNFLHEKGIYSPNAWKKYKSYTVSNNFVIVTDLEDTVENINSIFAGTKLEYQLLEEEIEPYTPAQQQAWDELQKFALYKGVNHITAESNELEPNMQLTYMQDTNTVIAKRLDNIESRLALLEE